VQASGARIVILLKLIQQMLKAGYEAKGQRFETPRGTPQGGVISPLLSNILLTSRAGKAPREAAAVRTLSRYAGSTRIMVARRATSDTKSLIIRHLTRGRSPVR
jgi:Reverse transcriptase (RNA-dependent DNA polymerase).